MTSPKPINGSLKFWLPLSFTLAVAIAGWGYGIAQFTTSDDVKEMIADLGVQRVVDRYDEDLGETRVALAEIKAKIEANNQKLDQVLRLIERRGDD